MTYCPICDFSHAFLGYGDLIAEDGIYGHTIYRGDCGTWYHWNDWESREDIK